MYTDQYAMCIPVRFFVVAHCSTSILLTYDYEGLHGNGRPQWQSQCCVHKCGCVYVCMYIYISICMYIYIYIQREEGIHACHISQPPSTECYFPPKRQSVSISSVVYRQNLPQLVSIPDRRRAMSHTVQRSNPDSG